MSSSHLRNFFVLGLVALIFGVTHTSGQASHGRTQGWGPWTGWSVCSETCGYGTAYRIRTCHHRNRDGETQCEGQSKQYKICKVENCKDNSKDYRWKECSKHNSVYYGRRQYTWVPYINEMAPCELSCKSVGYGYYARFKKKVADGVICSSDNTAMCMGGRCITSGCDGILYSTTRSDRCGVCGGDGSTCELVKGIFTRTHLTQRGYNVVTTIPAGARSINITELRRSRNHLALSTPTGYFLNGDMRLRSVGTIQGAGTSFAYRRGAGPHCPGECLTSPGPLNTSLRVELIYFGRNPGIMYDFTVPKESKLAKKLKEQSTNTPHDIAYSDTSTYPTQTRRIRVGQAPTYISDDATTPSTAATSQDLRSRSRNSRPSSQVKIRTRMTRRRGNRRDHRQREKSPQNYRTTNVDHDRSRSNVQSSRLNVHYEPNKQQYFVKGSNGSIQYKHYYHTNQHDDIRDVPVSDGSQGVRQKGVALRRQPPSYVNSNDAYSNRYAEFRSTTQYQPRPPAPSSYSSSTLPNVIRRNNIIPAPIRARGEKTAAATGRRYDNELKIASDRMTGVRDDYGLYKWKISGFTPCSETCGGGLQETRVICVKSDSRIVVIEENCDPSKRPEVTTIVCNTQPCKASWTVSEWTPCSVTCGIGQQKRTVECKQRISPTLTIGVRSSNCPARRPRYRQYCQMEACFTWRVSNWGECSTECGFGQRRRTVICVDTQGSEVSPRLCTQLRPKDTEICDKGSCAQGWFHTRWSKECSAQCGRGFYTRKVYCSASDGSNLEEKKCGGSKSKPREQKRCKASRPCGGKWFAGAWSKCNATCGSGAVRTRDVLCIKRHGKRLNHVVREHNCDPDTRPLSLQTCGPFPECAPEWFVMAWSSCSKSCGTGVRTREVKCIDSTFTPSADCDKGKKPSRRQSCNTQPCEASGDPEAPSRPDNGVTYPPRGSRGATSKATASAATKSSKAVRNDTYVSGGSNETSSDTAAGSNSTTVASSQEQELQRDGSAQTDNMEEPEVEETEDSEDESSGCRDVKDSRWCQMARQARLCGYYKAYCCRTCSQPGYS